MTMGACYYPEHWDRKLWKEDLERMLKAGITVIRIAEFGWNKVEPKEGVLYRHGARRHYNYNSPIYRELSARIVEKEAEHYGSHPAILGWQIDNELNCETDEFYSEADSAAFRVFLREKYGSLAALNEA